MTFEEIRHQQKTEANAQIGALVIARHGLRRQKYVLEAQIDDSARLFSNISMINLHLQVELIDSRLKYINGQLRALGLAEAPEQGAPEFEIVDAPRPEE